MLTLTLISVMILVGQADVPRTEEPPTRAAEATDEQIGAWIEALDADRFSDREWATEKLVAVGRRVIPAVLESADEDNLEVATRVVFVLQQLALSPESETEASAHEALRQLAGKSDSSAQRPAKRSLEQLASYFEGRALDELQRLGAEINMSVLATGGQRIEAINSVEIGKRWKGSEADLRHLQWLSNLGELKLLGDQVHDEWLQVVSTMKNLGRLRMKHASVTDAGMAHLQHLALLQLHIWYSDVTDGCIDQLAAVEGVREIQLYGTRVTREGADRLAEAMQGVAVDFRPGGALLGVQCHNDIEKCTILGVQAKSAAAKGGLRKNDIIVEYDGQPVQNFEQLRQFIGKNAPGDRVQVKVRRGGKSIEAEVELGEWQW